MNLSRVIVGGVILSIVLLLLPRQSSGDKAVPRIVKLTIDCENRFDVTDVDPGVTQDPPDIYVCEGDTVTWYPNNHNVVITFKKSPFKDHKKVFKASGTTPVTSDKMAHFDHITTFEFSVDVDEKYHYDPTVIGGGRH